MSPWSRSRAKFDNFADLVRTYLPHVAPISERSSHGAPQEDPVHLFRWDLDKTYLETDILSSRGLLHAALQAAADKRTTPGADVLIRGLRNTDPSAQLAFVSGSPRPMRGVIEAKLTRDALGPFSLELKDNLGNLRRGRLRALREQLGYKLPVLLRARASAPAAQSETLFGDDAELDAAIYTAYREIVAGRLPREVLARWIDHARLYPDQARDIWRFRDQIRPEDAVESIFILTHPRRPLAPYRLLGGAVIAVSCWFQAGIVLWARGRLRAAYLPELYSRCVDRAAPPDALGGLVQDLVRRGAISVTSAIAALTEAPFEAGTRKAAISLLEVTPHPQFPIGPPDLEGFLRALAAAGAREGERGGVAKARFS